VRLRWWLSGLVVSVLVWLVWLMPAQPLVSRLHGVMLGNAPLELSRIEGRIWQGSARWRWQRHAGSLRWQTRWQGLTPGIQLQLQGDLLLSGWFGGRPGRLVIRELDVAVPVAPFVAPMPNVTAEGAVSLRGLSLDWNGRQLTGANGLLGYSGGEVSWAPGQSAVLPPLTGALRQDGGAAIAEARSPEGALLAEARVENEMALLRVYRAWPALLGVSQGGSPADVVFETSQPLGGGP
jgi:general secretion pathway protein N